MFITTGVMSQLAMEATLILEEQGFNCGVMHMHTIKPIDAEALKHWGPKLKSIISVEEHSLIGGLGTSILEFISENIANRMSSEIISKKVLDLGWKPNIELSDYIKNQL